MPLRRLIEIAWSPVANLFRPPLVPSTDAELAEVERAIDEEAGVHPFVVRARQALAWQQAAKRKGMTCLYGLGWGGRDPKAGHPFQWDPKAKAWKCDCSGYEAWIMGYPRKLDGYGYIWTDGTVRDAKRDVPGDLGFEVPRHETAPGDMIVYGSVDTDGDGDRDIIGHVGCATEVRRPFVSYADSVTVIHCASRGDGPIREKRDGKIWERRGLTFRVRDAA